MTLKQNLPNALTLANLASGCLGIVQVLTGDAEAACWLILLAGVFDFFDGMLARALKVTSAIGKDLDSLADMVSFGVLPGLMAGSLIWESLSGAASPEPGSLLYEYLPFIFLLMPLLSAVRLARFNNDSRQQSSFVGLPTPANALFWVGLATGIHNEAFVLLNNPWLLTALTIALSLLLVTPLPMFSFKFSSFSWRSNRLRYLFLLITAPLLLWLGIPGLAPVIVLYVLVSVAHSLSTSSL